MESTVSFDLDGTLVTSASSTVLQRVISELGGSADTQATVLGRHHDLLLRHPYDAYDWASIIGAVVGVNPEGVQRKLVEGLIGATPTLLHDHTVDSLAGLRVSGFRVVILTNGRRAYQVPVIEAAGITPVIDELVTSDDVGETKPAPSLFAAAARGTRLVHVGDRLDHDVVGANRVGATSVLLREDVPFTSSVSDLGAVDRSILESYLRELAESEGVVSADSVSSEWWPDVVASTLRDAVGLIGDPSHR